MAPRRGGRAYRVDRAACINDPDNTHCWLCHKPVDKSLPGTHAWGPSADHEVPLMLGGPELVRDGAVLHLAHNRCNAARSNRLRARLGPHGLQRAARARRTTSRDW
jgi:hypothetical protein